MSGGSKFPLIGSPENNNRIVYIGHSLYPVSEKNSCHVFFPFTPPLNIKLQTCSPAVRSQYFIDKVSECNFSNPMELMGIAWYNIKYFK